MNPTGHNPPTGLFITFEGVEGSGKTTQVSLLEHALRARGHRVVVTREPGGEPTAEAIRQVVLGVGRSVTPAAELLLFMAARAQVVAHIIRQELHAGAIVLCDRYADSSVAYQGHARGQDLDVVRRLNAFATGDLVPAATFLLDLDPEVGLHRQSERNRMEAEALEFHRRVRAGYLAEARREPDRFHVLDASRPTDEIHMEILAAVERILARS